MLRHIPRRAAGWTALALSVATTLSGLQFATAPAAQAAPHSAATLNSSGTATINVLPGAAAVVNVIGTNSGNTAGFNLGVSAVLPAGVSYVPGSARPGTLLGDPVAYPDLTNPDPATRNTTLVWTNVADLQPSETLKFSFSVVASTTTFPVGSHFAVSTELYTNSDPRYAPKFDAATNAFDPSTFDATTVADTTLTNIVPFTITKSEPSPEHEIMRGIHASGTTPTTYTLKVQNNNLNASSNVVLTDFLPAELEYLGCGGVNADHTVINTPEFTYLGPNPPAGSGPDLNGLTPIGTGCASPDSITTTNTEAPAGVTPGPVFTKLAWDLGTLAPGASTTVTFYVGAPLQANTMNWAQVGGGTSTTPPAGLTTQGVNLDNNNGAFTTQTAVALSVKNVAEVSGDYSGPTEGDNHFTSSDAVTNTLQDLAVYKTESPSTFNVGGLVSYNLHVRTSEYRRATNIVLTDHLPSGMCPVDANQNYSAYTGSAIVPDPACAPVGGANPSHAYSNVTANADGSFDITWNLPNQQAAAETVVSFKARMLSTYAGTTGTLSGLPTVGGDTFTNNVTVTGTTLPVTDEAGGTPQSVSDTSSATLDSAGPTIGKEVAADNGVTPMDCSAAGITWLHPATSADQPVYHLGDRVCFRLTMNFPNSVSTQDAVITDFLPAGVAYEAGSLTTNFPGSQNTVPGADISTTTPAAGPVIALGHGAGGSGHLYVSPGQTFDAIYSVLVTSDVLHGVVYDVPGNLMKVRATNSAGTAIGLRDQVDFKIGSTPHLDLQQAKSITAVNGVATPAGTMKATARTGDVVSFAIALNNAGAQAAGDLRMWDLLPPGFTCATVSMVSDAATCADHVTTTAGTGSVITWYLAGANVIPALGTRTPLTYDVTVPAGVSLGTSYINTSSIRSYTTTSNLDVVTDWYPADNIDPTVTSTLWNEVPASDTAIIATPAATVTKTNSTSVTEPGNAATGQATIGEGIVWTVTATIPHGTTTYSGALTDNLPAGVTATGAATLTVNGASNPSFSLNTTGSTYTVTLPTPYTLTPAAADTTLVLRVPVRVDDVATNVRGSRLTNSATLTAAADPNTDASISTPKPVTATNTVTVVEPNLSLTKSDNATNSTVLPGQGVTYTINVANLAGANVSTAHNVVVHDEVPSGLSVAPATITPAPQSVTVHADGSTSIVWSLGTVNPGATSMLTYLATVSSDAVSGQRYTNEVEAEANSLEGDGRNEGVGYRPQAQDVVTIASPTLTKSVTPSTATIGQTVTYTVTVTVPGLLNVPTLTLLDKAPAGLTNITPVSATCVQAGAACNEFVGTTLASNPAHATMSGWYLGQFTGAGSIVNGQPVDRVITITYTAKVADVAGNTAGANLTNSAALYWGDADDSTPPTQVPESCDDEFDFHSGDATATVTVTEPSVSIAKSVDKSTLGPTDVATFKVTATNATGANATPAYGVVITDTVPAGLAVNQASISNGGVWNSSARTITWTLAGPLAPGASSDVTYQATLAASSTLHDKQLITNSAALTSYTGVPGDGGRTYSGNTATASVTAVFPTVTIGKVLVSPSPQAVQLNQPTVWRLTVTNTGDAPATGLSVNDVLPANWAYTSGSATVQGPIGSAVNAEPGIAPSASGDTLTWTALPDLAPGQSDVITYTAVPTNGVIVNPGVGPGNWHINKATVATATDASGATGNADRTYAGASATAQVTIASADVSITKTHTGAIVPGTAATWTITVANAGPNAAAGSLTVTDVLPASATFLSATGSGWSCSNSGAGAGTTITCTSATGLDANAMSTITVMASIDSSATGTIANTATVSGPSYDPNTNNNTTTDTTTLQPSSDLAVVKTQVGEATAGAAVTWAIHVTNNGPSDATGITVTDTLPSVVSNANVLAPGWACTVTPATGAGQQVTCTYANAVPPGAAVPNDIQVMALLASGTTGMLSNTATVTGTNPDPNPANNTNTSVEFIGHSADLSITKTHTQDLVPGTNFDWTISVYNDGPSDAAAPHVTDTLPAGVSYVSATGTGWSCVAGNANTVRCDYNQVLAASTFAPLLIIKTFTAPNLTGPVTNNASVVSSTPDPNLANNTAGDTVNAGQVSNQVDLVLTKTHEGPAVAGGSVTYALNVSNKGPSDELGPVTVTDALPAGMAYSSSTGVGWLCSATGQTATCTYSGSIAANSAAPTLNLTASIAPNVGATTLINQATVTGTGQEVDPSNNGASDPTPITVQTDLSLTKTASAEQFASGISPAGTFTLQVTNHGPSTAADPITVVDTLPVGLTYAGGTGTGWSCGAIAQVVTCTSTTPIDPGSAAAPITVSVGTAVGLGDPNPVTLTNTATVSTTEGQDLNPGNNTATAQVNVAATADLSITKTHPVDPAPAGSQVPFTITVHNAGPSPAAGPITVVDSLPDHFTYVSASSPWTCGASGQDVTCTLAQSVAPGADAPVLTLTALIASNAPITSETNHASVSSSTPDSSGLNNSTNDVVNISHSADLTIVKSHVGQAEVGQHLTYKLSVANHGPSDAFDVVVTDHLPAGVSPVSVSVTGNPFNCVFSGQVLTCTAASMAAGATSEISVTVLVLPAATAGLINTASVTSPTPDPTPDNNTSTDTIDSGSVLTYDLRMHKTLASYTDSTQTAVWHMQVENVGNGVHEGVMTVVDNLPNGLVYRSASGPGWTITHHGQVVIAVSNQRLAAGARSTIISLVTKVTAPPGTVITNQATVTAGPGDHHHNTGGTSFTPHLPHTGAGNNYAYLLFGALLMLLGLVVFGRRRVRE